ncbi:serine/arginine repetitive matrix protein 2 isoform X3 [Pogonomyrmex barbatus]|uniref:Microtubule-associated protein n=1 Tax=Pogonomyrmex barbatus TaxID=144034 RepID=A0A6I9WCY8_9HYME|nr:serine/arginine repetitive matrix protein 2 isoform X3 [Pogonomyrmex barbatus]
MDSQQTANSVAEPTSGHGETMVKPNASLPPQGFQVRPQGPPPSPRNSINNGPVGAPRPGPPLRRLDSRSSLGPPPTSGQFVQLRPYGPPRPPGSSFSPRSPQPGQLPPQNPLLPPNQRFPYSPGIRGPSPQGASGQQRPPFVINQQAYQAQQQQQQQQQQQRSGNDPRFQRPDIAPPQNGPRRSSQESVFPRQLLRNDSSLSLQRQHLLSNEEIKQPTRPRIVIEKMADINETNLDKPEGYLQRKNDENDDDDDVVMDNEKSPRHNGEDAPEGLVNGSKSPLTPRKVDDSRPASRPGTATIEDKAEKMDDKRDAPSRPISANIDDTATLISQSRPSSAVNNDKEEKKEESLDSRPPSSKEINAASMSEEIKKPSSPHDDTFEGTEQSLKTPSKSSEHSRSATPSHLDAEQDKNSDRSRSSTPARLEPSDNAEQESKTPVKTPDKSRSNTPASLEASGNAEQESRTPELKTPDKSRASTPTSQLAPSPDAERESETAARTPNRSRSSTPRAGIESSNDEDGAFAGTENPSENPHRDKSADTLQVKESSRPASSLSLTSEKGGKSPRSPTTPRSPEGVKGYDNGQQRSLSASGSPRLPNSPKSPISEKQTEDGKKRTSFVEDSAEKIEEIANQTAVAMTKPTTPTPKTPRAQTPSKLDIEKAEKKKEVQNGSPSESQVSGTPTTNGVGESPTKKSKEVDKRSNAGSPTKSTKSLPRTPDTPSSTAQEKKKLPMNKIQVGAAPSPNLKTVRSKIGSLDNASYKPGGGKVKIENRKLDFGSKAQPKIAAKNEKYTPSGGDKKIAQVKLQWNAKSKVGSLENATYKPGGGDKKIETVKLDFKDKAKPKVGSKENAKHVPGGGSVKSATPPKTPQETKNDIPTQKIEIKAESKIGSLDNVKHKPGGGDKKIFNDRDYLRQTSSNVESLNGSGSQSPVPSGAITDSGKNGLPASDENLNQEC